MSTTTSHSLTLQQPGFPERLVILEHDARHTLVQVELEPGGGTPMHIHHDYAEHFEVLEGRVDIEFVDDRVQLEPGQRCSAEAKVPHRFVNNSSAPARFLVSIEPGETGFLEMQLVFFGLRRDGRVTAEGAPRDPRHVAVVFGWSGTAPADARGRAAMRVLRLIARVTGEERRLRARYVIPAQAKIAAFARA